MSITESIKKIVSPDSTLGERGTEALNLLKRGTKAAFTNKDGSVDKAAVMGAVAFASSYLEARALAADAGVDLLWQKLSHIVNERHESSFKSMEANLGSDGLPKRIQPIPCGSPPWISVNSKCAHIIILLI